VLPCIGVARAAKGPCPPKILEDIVILCFERRFSQQNNVSRLKSNILAHQNFWTGDATASMHISHLLCYFAGVKTAAFVTVYAQISFLGSFMFSFFVVTKDVLKTASVDKR